MTGNVYEYRTGSTSSTTHLSIVNVLKYSNLFALFLFFIIP